MLLLRVGLIVILKNAMSFYEDTLISQGSIISNKKLYLVNLVGGLHHGSMYCSNMSTAPDQKRYVLLWTILCKRKYVYILVYIISFYHYIMNGIVLKRKGEKERMKVKVEGR